MRLTPPDAASTENHDLQALALQELERVLSSEEFAKAERMRRFLRYAVEQTLANDLERLKETVIGVEVFDRQPSYDPKADPIVRIEARRLREKLKQFYERDNEPSPVRIELPKGAYVASLVVAPNQPAVAGEPESATVVLAEPLPVLSPAVPESPARRGDNRRRWLAMAVTALLLLAGLLLWLRSRSQGPVMPLELRSFTSLPGAETDPTISPDGTKVTYVWTGGERGEPDLYVQAIDSFTPVRLTKDGGVSSPVWSPDSKQIAYLGSTGPSRFRISIVDLATREIRHGAEVESDPFPIGLAIYLDWSPDGKFFVTTHRRNLVLIPAAGGPMRQLTTAPDRALGDYDPVFSPDGGRVAFRRALSFGVSDLYVAAVEGNAPLVRLTHQNQSVGGHTWSSDGQSLVFSLSRNLWRVKVSGGEPQRIAAGTVKAFRPSVARSGGRLVFASPSLRSRIWRLSVDGSSAPQQVLSSTVSDASPDISPDGSRIAFRSDRSGSDEIWLANSDGSNPIRLTRFEGPLTGCPRWSPDGSQLALDSRPEGKSDIFLVMVEGGAVRRFTNDPAEEVVPSWSRDGRHLYYSSNRTGHWQVWKQPLPGGPAVQVTKDGGFAPWESFDGKYVYYAKNRSGYGLWRVGVNGGDEEAVLPDLQPGMWGNWHIGPREIFFGEATPPFRVRALDPATSRQREIARLPLELLSGDAGMAVSPDGKWLYVALSEPLASDLYLVDNFH